MLAIGAGGLEVAIAMAGEPFSVKMPRIWGVQADGRAARWVSAKDVILEMLRRHGVAGGIGKIIEYHGPGLDESERDGPPRDRQHGGRARAPRPPCSLPTSAVESFLASRGAAVTG